MPKTRKTKSRKSDITRLKKASSQVLAIKDRRRLVHLKLQQHLTIREIAIQLNVATATVLKDKQAIAKSLAVEHSDVKAIDLDDLDTMERDCINQLEQRLTEVGALIQDVDGMDELGPTAPKILKVMYDNAGSWWDKRLRLKQLKGKWLGYEAKQDTTVEQQNNIQDNSIKVFVQAPSSGVPGSKEEEKPVSFGDYAKDILISRKAIDQGIIEGVIVEADNDDRGTT